jgi:hypothetical protein
VTIGFGSNQFSIRCVIPKISTAGAEEIPGEPTEQDEEWARIVAVMRGARELEEKVLERLLRMRLCPGFGISVANCQAAPSALAKRLKTIELHLKNYAEISN